MSGEKLMPMVDLTGVPRASEVARGLRQLGFVAPVAS
jgi:hypothetical protein